jgi:hypothetical protein
VHGLRANRGVYKFDVEKPESDFSKRKVKEKDREYQL